MKTVDRLLPFRQVHEQDTVNQFALDGTGVMGMFVSVSSGNFDDQHNWDFNNSPGATFDDISSFLYTTKTKVRPCTSGDSRENVLGITLFNVAETDENGEKYRYYKQKAKENRVVLSGSAVPVGTRGFYMVTSNAWSNTTGDLPQVGDVMIPSNSEDGKVEFLGRGSATESQILGDVIGTGAKFDGYAYIRLRG